MNRPKDRRRNPTHPHTMKAHARSRRRGQRWYDRHPEVLASLGRFDQHDLHTGEEFHEPTTQSEPLDPEEEACMRERELMYWRDMNRWGTDVEEHPELLAYFRSI